MKKVSRVLRWIGITAVMGVFASAGFAQTTGIPVPTMAHCDTMMQSFLTTWGIQGGTMALTRNGKLVYMRGFGRVNQTGTDPVQPHHMFRIASLSKPITSVAVMKLMQEGQINLDAKVFGPTGILADNTYFSSANVTDQRIFDITVRQLLEHSAGWNRDLPMTPSPLPPYPWGYASSDPIGFPLHVTQTLGEANPVSRRALIKWSMQRGLDFTPGTAYNYSNIGYIVLAEVIEEITGLPYDEYVKTEIFEPIGAYDIHLGRNLLVNKREREGEYVNTFTTLSAYGTGQTVPWQYGGWNLEAMDAHGGWIASARDLVRFINAVDGYATRPDLLTVPTLQTMTQPSANQVNYAKGWQVLNTGFNGNWWHTGSLDGSASFMARTNGQFTWAMIFNERTGGNFFGAMDALPWNCMAQTSSYPTHDLFDVPSVPSEAFTVDGSRTDGMSISWTPGGGTGRVVVARSGAVPNRHPLDGVDYTAPQGGPYTDLGGGNFVVYSGSGSEADISGLAANTTYHFRVYEYNKSANTGNNALYQLGTYLEASAATLAPGANVSITGRVFSSTGTPAPLAVVTVRDKGDNIVAVSRANTFGNYRLLNLAAGSNYSIQVSARREQFDEISLTLTGNLTGFDIFAAGGPSIGVKR